MTDLSPTQQYAEEASVVLAGMGMPPAYGKLFGWLLICDPPQQTSAQLTVALGLSKGSVSTGTRMLENAGLIRRVPVRGQRGYAYEAIPDGLVMAASEPSKFRAFRELMARGLELVGGRDAPAADRLRLTHDFYAYIEREMPQVARRFYEQYRGKGETDG